MKAIILKQFGGAENFELADIPVPPVHQGQVRIKIAAVSFNPVDYQIRRGLSESKMVSSNILGRDLSGVVDEVGEGVTNFKKGDEVYSYVCNLGSSGTYTEFITVPGEIVAKKPVSLSYEQAAAVPVAAITAIISITKAKAEPSKSMFIAGGAGGVGSFVIALARYWGVKKIITTAGSERSKTYLKDQLQLKEEQVVNYKEKDFIKQAVDRNGGLFDIAIDLVGDKMLAACCELIAIDGQLVSVVDAPDKDSFEFLFQKNGSFHSVGANAYSLSDDRKQWQTYQQMLNNISTAYDSKGIKPPAINVVGSLSVETVRQAHQMLENNSVQGKLVMTC